MVKPIEGVKSIGIQSIVVWLQSLHPSLCTRLRFKKKKKAAENGVLAVKESRAEERMG